MADEKKMSRKDELDDFWDLSDLVPRQKIKGQRPMSQNVIKSADIVSEHSQNTVGTNAFADQPIDIKKLVNSANNPSDTGAVGEPLLEYSPENSLIHKVKIYRFESNYNYYEQFRIYANKFFSVEGKECQHVPYFSYVPQYNQLDSAQLKFYFWWRTQVRNGIYIYADYSYILLYVFETINLCGEYDYEQLRDLLFGVWLAYRKSYPRLDKLLSEWIFDFCLIHRLAPPRGKLPLAAIEGSCGVAEFFVSSVGNDFDKYVSALLIFCNSYDYKKSKFYEGENKEIYDRYVHSALRVAVDFLSSSGKILADIGYSDSKLNRQAYVGALSSYSAKRRIEIEFCSFSRSHELRYLVGDIIKYTENIIRGYIGVKSKLSVYSLKPELAMLISEHLKNVLPPKKRTAPRDVRDKELDNLYEPIHKEFSLENAAKIEMESWQTTKILAEAFAEDEETLEIMEPIDLKAEENVEKKWQKDEQEESFVSRLGEFSGYLCALVQCKYDVARDEIRKIGKPIDTVIDYINEIALEFFGDIIIEGDEDSYTLIEDYLEDVISEFRKQGEFYDF